MSDQRFNTGNPIGSNSPLDRSDNTRNLDLAVNSSDAEWSDRFGQPRLTFAGMQSQFSLAQELRNSRFQIDQAERASEFDADQVSRDQRFDADQAEREQRFNTFIASSGYQFAGDYAPGIEITEYNQVIRDENGEFWRVSGQVDLPYVTTGAGVPEDDALVPAGDAVLRQDLANPDKGAAMVGFDNTEFYPANSVGAAISAAGRGFYYVSASTWGLVKGSAGDAPYTQQQYDDAYNNGERLKNALEYARDKGFLGAILEKGEYALCLINMSGTNIMTRVQQESPLRLEGFHGFTIDLGGSTLSLIYDSDNRSPYDKGTGYLPYRLVGRMFLFAHCRDTTIQNGTLLGDRVKRSYNNPGERWEEQTTGISIGGGCFGMAIRKVDGGLFMGDLINTQVGAGNPPLHYGNIPFLRGGVSTTGSEIDEEGSYRTPLLDITTALPTGLIKLAAIGGIQSPTFREPIVRAFFYTSSGDFISSQPFLYGQSVRRPGGDSQVRFVAYGDERTDPVVKYDYDNGSTAMILVAADPEGLLIEDVVAYSCHRGGISNLPSGSSVRRVKLYHNGSLYGMPSHVPIFPDTTRYGLNCEDHFPDTVTIEDLEVVGSANSVMLIGRVINVDGLVVSGGDTAASFSGLIFGTVMSANVNSLVISDKGLSGISIAPKSPFYRRNILVSGVTIVDTSTLVSAIEANVDIDSDTLVVRSVSGNASIGSTRGVVLEDISLNGSHPSNGDITLRDRVVGLTYNAEAAGSTDYFLFDSREGRDNTVILRKETQEHPTFYQGIFNRQATGVTFKSVEGGRYNMVLSTRSSAEGHPAYQSMTMDKCVMGSVGALSISSGKVADAFVEERYIFKDTEFREEFGRIMLVGVASSESDAPLYLKFIGCDINLTGIVSPYWFLYRGAPTGRPVHIEFVRCFIHADTPTTGPLIAGSTANLTSKMIACQVYNFTNSDGVTVEV